MNTWHARGNCICSQSEHMLDFNFWQGIAVMMCQDGVHGRPGRGRRHPGLSAPRELARPTASPPHCHTCTTTHPSLTYSVALQQKQQQQQQQQKQKQKQQQQQQQQTKSSKKKTRKKKMKKKLRMLEQANKTDRICHMTAMTTWCNTDSDQCR